MDEYLCHKNLAGMREAVRRTYAALSRVRGSFDTIYVTGQSGIVPGSIVAWRLDKPLLILRKATENAHSAIPPDALLSWTISSTVALPLPACWQK